jgi:thiol-disulfide isomerase/thioredoxin
MRYSFKDLLSDALMVGLALVVGGGIYVFMKPSFSKLRASLSSPAGGTSSPLAEGTAIDLNWSVETLDGHKISLSSFKGKVIFLNFWATWCGPCLLELPSIETLIQTFKGTDVVFLCVTEEEADKVRAFIQTDPIAAPIYRVAQLPRSLQMRALPTTFIIGRDGRVAYSRAGAADWSRKNIVQMIKGLLQAPRAESDK